MAKACRSGIITFRTSRGRVVSFKGRHGASCGPRKKPSTRHLAPYKKAFATASRKCFKANRNPRGARACIATAMHQAKRVRVGG